MTKEYTFKKINGNPVKSASGLLEDYWFGHWIQHGSGNQVNVTITTGYEIKAKKDIEIGEELFLDYICFKKCNFCGNMCLFQLWSLFYLFSVLWQKTDQIIKKHQLCLNVLSGK